MRFLQLAIVGVLVGTSAIHLHARDDDEEQADGEKKEDEVDAIMNRYDTEEKEEAFKKSPEYAAQQKALAEKKAQAEQAKTEEL